MEDEHKRTTGDNIEKPPADSASGDQELDDLLDSALADFDKPSVKTKTREEHADSCSSIEPISGEPEWSEEFINQATTQFEDVMKNFLSEDPNLLEDFKQFAETAAKATSDTTSDSDFAANLEQTLKGLAENAKALNNSMGEDDIANLLSNLGMGGAGGMEGAGGELSDLLPFMTNMMQSILSKDMLYPAIKEIVEKYPDWLADNRPKLAVDQYDKYNRQYDLMKQVCQQFEAEAPGDSDDVKKKRFENILDIMQKMQECGQPPKELIGELGPGMEVDAEGNLKMPGFPNMGADGQCAIM